MLHNEGKVSSAALEGRALERLFELAVVLNDLMNEHLEALGLTPARAEVLWLLVERGPLTQRQLSESLQCTPRNVTGLVDALEESGFVARQPHPTDRRAVLVNLTRKGRRVATGLRGEHRQGAGDLFTGVAPADVTTFAAVLDVVVDRFRRRQEDG
jgi:DNA-binding MarR family transcriptional regulator